MAIKDNLFDEEKIRAHIRKTIQEYLKTLKEASIKDLNKNIIDPIKLTFDKNVFNLTMDTLIANELLRQNDKTISNIIGYFNQNLFKFINVGG
jgi:DNA-directed RNA polymerase alpha subunit